MLAGDLTSEFALERGDFDSNGSLEIADLDLLQTQGLGGTAGSEFDANRDGLINVDDQTQWIESLARTYVGDANFDGSFGTSDLVTVFQSGLYESATPGSADWATGDWNLDGSFDTSDLVAAFQAGGFEQGRRELSPLALRLDGELVTSGLPVVVDGVQGTMSVTTDPYTVARLQSGNDEQIVSVGEDGVAMFAVVPFQLGLNRITVTAEDRWGTHQESELLVTRVAGQPYDYRPWGDLLKVNLTDDYFVPSAVTAYLPAEITRADILREQTELERTKPVAGRAQLLQFQANLSGDESEASNETGANDLVVDAELVDGFGTGADQHGTAIISGTLLPIPVELVMLEDDGDITRANETNLLPGQAIRAQGAVGDGPHGSTGSGSGDFDMFAIRNVVAGQTITVDVNTPDDSTLDSFAYIYNSDGVPVDVNDDFGISTDSRLKFQAFEDGDYFVSIAGYGTFGPVDATDSSSGIGAASEGEYEVIIGFESDTDVDMYAVELDAGDVFAAGVSGGGTKLTLYGPNGDAVFASGQDASFIYPSDSPLPTGNATLAWVADTAGTYTIAVDEGVGNYELELFADKTGRVDEVRGTKQILFLDFDGETFSPLDVFGLGRTSATLDPLVSFLPNWGLTPNEEAAVVEAVRVSVEENFRDIGVLGVNGDRDVDGVDGNFGIEVVTSRDYSDARGFPVDLFGDQNVSRVIVGGTSSQLGITTIGIAQSIDVGNLNAEETAVVLLDFHSRPAGDVNSLNSIPLDPSASMIDLLGTAIGNIVAHEAGHYFGSWHTNALNSVEQLMDQGGDITQIVGVGADGIFGSDDDEDVDFGVDVLAPNEGFEGFQNSIDVLAFGLSTGTVDEGLVISDTIPGNDRRVTEPPTEFVVRFSDAISADNGFDPGLLSVNTISADSVVQSGPAELTFSFDVSPVTVEGSQQIIVEPALASRDSDGSTNPTTTIDFGYDRQVMEVVGFSPAPGDVQLPFGTLTVDFSEAIDPNSVGTDDLLLNVGTVSSAEAVDEDTVAYTLEGLTAEGTLEVWLMETSPTNSEITVPAFTQNTTLRLAA